VPCGGSYLLELLKVFFDLIVGLNRPELSLVLANNNFYTDVSSVAVQVLLEPTVWRQLAPLQLWSQLLL
jgi:hypothetical protein